MKTKGRTKGTQAQLARLLKISQPAVSALVNTGVITLTPDRKVWLEDAVRDYHTKTNVAQRRELEVKAGKSEQFAVPSAGYHEARARREIAEATLAELKLKEAEGKLIDAVAAKKAFMDVGVAVRDRLLALPQRLAPLLVGMNDEVAVSNILNNELQVALSGFTRDAI